MADRIYPSKIIQAHTPLGIDQNNDWRALRLDKQSDGAHSLRVSTLADRSLVKGVYRYSASLADHSPTERFNYTVPSGKRVLFEYLHFHIAQPSEGKIRACYLRVNYVYILTFIVEYGNTLWRSRSFDQTLNIWLPAGGYFSIVTYSDDTVSGTFEFSFCFSQFDA